MKKLLFIALISSLPSLFASAGKTEVGLCGSKASVVDIINRFFSNMGADNPPIKFEGNRVRITLPKNIDFTAKDITKISYDLLGRLSYYDYGVTVQRYAPKKPIVRVSDSRRPIIARGSILKLRSSIFGCSLNKEHLSELERISFECAANNINQDYDFSLTPVCVDEKGLFIKTSKAFDLDALFALVEKVKEERGFVIRVIKENTRL